jgi:hypothetical protein
MVELSETLDEQTLIDPKIQEKELLSDPHFQQFLAKAKHCPLDERALLKIFIVSQMHAGKAMEALTETLVSCLILINLEMERNTRSRV